MGFCATDQLEAALESHQENPAPMSRRSLPAKADPSKNRVWNFFTTSDTCTGFSESQPVESHQEKWPIPTTTASGVRYYGHRFYSAELSRWVSRDPIRENGFELISRRQQSSDSELEQSIHLSKLDFLLLQLRGSTAFRSGAMWRSSELAEVYMNLVDERNVLERTIQQTAAEKLSMTESHLYSFAINNPIDFADVLGLHTRGYCRLLFVSGMALCAVGFECPPLAALCAATVTLAYEECMRDAEPGF
jgi:hypothetical protein